MIPEFPDFKILELSDREEIEWITKHFPPYSNFHFMQMWIWDIHEPVTLSKFNNNLVDRQSDTIKGSLTYSLIGTNAIPTLLEKLWDHFAVNGISPSFSCIPEETINDTNGFALSALEDRDNFDYIFDVEKIYHAKGHDYENYRKQLNKFAKKHPQTVTRKLDLNKTIVQEQINTLFVKLSHNIKPENRVGNIHYEYQALNKLISHSNEFETLTSLGLYDKDELIAVVMFDIINKDYSLSPFLLANKDYDGSFQYLMKKAIEILHNKGVKYLNCEPDFGIAAWRTYKMSYRPAFFLKKYKIENGSYENINKVKS